MDAVKERPAGSFNPRPRVGSDYLQRLFHFCHRRFNPRPRVGSDSGYQRQIATTGGFNPRPRVGSDMVIFSLPA